ncbi:MAG TPA: hypothetical protein VGJ60_27765 [Chloroflexota bacterium]|jgi:hypothetical protein
MTCSSIRQTLWPATPTTGSGHPDPTATVSDGNLVRLTAGPGLDVLPLPTMTLRQADVLSGYIVFDVPQGVTPVELVWRQTDTDQVVRLSVLN